ncbi:hypothetical protein Micbo1qcDRAFT_207018 [Microdochium bolleyi]|uniref:BTB domain-containing protein n=1 Tax=Microdochium bolleyi TaxID=196109 RepID=A0A136IV65_9PEZI|nr:hypothetical protein Micbo1qcDRAFT_207018 [Microdochium bolleyi]
MAHVNQVASTDLKSYSQIVPLAFKDGKILHVHGFILDKATITSDATTPSFPDISVEAGQILVHYLYTSTLELPDFDGTVKRAEQGSDKQATAGALALLSTVLQLIVLSQELHLEDLAAALEPNLDTLHAVVQRLYPNGKTGAKKGPMQRFTESLLWSAGYNDVWAVAKAYVNSEKASEEESTPASFERLLLGALLKSEKDRLCDARSRSLHARRNAAKAQLALAAGSALSVVRYKLARVLRELDKLDKVWELPKGLQSEIIVSAEEPARTVVSRDE